MLFGDEILKKVFGFEFCILSWKFICLNLNGKYWILDKMIFEILYCLISFIGENMVIRNSIGSSNSWLGCIGLWVCWLFW